ncbi:hypothetical protein RUND412_001908 [Rhizina undulata]
MPLLDPSLPLQKSTEITKRLRSRCTSAELCALLPFARSVLSEEGNVIFPRRGEWVLEWAVQRLREEEDGTARTNPEFWELLASILIQIDLSAAAGILKRQNFLQMLLKALDDAVKVFTNDDADGNVDMSDIEEIFSTPQESPRSSGSSTTERGSPGRYSRLRWFLREVSAVIELLQSSGKEVVVAVLRGSLEVGAGVLGGYLCLARRVIDAEERVENEWTRGMVGIWKGCVWGKGEFKKLASLLATSCLPSATALLANSNTPEHLKTVIEEIVSEYIFLPDILLPASKLKNPKPSAKGLIPILSPLKSPNHGGIPELFSIALSAHSKKSGLKLDVEIAETIFLAFTEGILGMTIPTTSEVPQSNTDTIIALLEVLRAKGASISPALLSNLIDLLSNLSRSTEIRWGIVELALKLDFDTFLGPGKESLVANLFSAISGAGNECNVRRVLELLAEGYVKTRDLEGFVSRWREELLGTEGVWASDETARVVAGFIEKSWLPGQIARMLKNAVDAGEWVVADTLVRSIQQEENVNAVREVLQAVVDALPGRKPDWREWRFVVRALQMDGVAIAGGFVEKAVETVVKAKEYREILFAFEAVMAAKAELESLEKVLEKCALLMGATERGWTGVIEEINENNVGMAIGTSVAGRWLGALENVKADVRTGFVDAFLGMAVRGLNQLEDNVLLGRNSWEGMLKNGELFEFVGLKDAVLAALIAQLKPYSTLSSELTSISVEKLLKKIPAPSTENLVMYGFVLESISFFPLEAIKRSAREKLLDSLLLLDAMLQRDTSNVGDVPDKILRLMEKLWGVGNASSFMATDINGLLILFQGAGDRITVGRNLLRHAFTNKDQSKTHEFLTSLINRLVSLSGGSLGTGITSLCVVVITEFWKHRDDVLVNPSHGVETLKNELMRRLGSAIKAAEAIGQLSGMINAWRKVYELELDDENMTAEARRLVSQLIAKYASRFSLVLEGFGSEAEEKEGVVAVTRLACACARSGDEAVKASALVVAVVDSVDTCSQQERVLDSYRNMLGRLKLEGYREVVEKAVESCFPVNKNVGRGYWEVLKVLVANVEKPEDEDTARQLGDFMSTVYSNLAMNLPRTVTESGFLAVADCMDIMLREKSWTIHQYNIDETLLSTTLTASPRGPTLISDNQSTLFHRLTRLTSSILALHRRRIAGRYHLIISLFQSLLNCVHLPKPSRKKSEKPIHPGWLTTPLPVESAVAYTRILTALCDPPTSSVTYLRSSLSQVELVNSATVAAKKAVGRHVGYLLVGFVKMSLEHRMDLAVREEMKRAWWAVFDVVDREVLRTLNAGLDTPGRAILRGMFEEWRKFKGEKV